MRGGLLIVPVIVLALAGCTVGTLQARPSATPTAAGGPSAPVRTATPTPSPSVSQPFPLAPHPSANVTVVPNEYLANPDLTNVIYWVELPSADTGPIEYAEGTPIMEGSKVVAYKVASGDIWDFIAKRFGLSNDGYILAVNQVRRGGNNSFLYAGDVVNLSAYTMHKYGSANGTVLNNPDPSPMPRQEP